MRSIATIEVKKEMIPRSVDKCNVSAVLVALALGLELAELLVELLAVLIPPVALALVAPPPVAPPPVAPPPVVPVVVDP